MSEDQTVSGLICPHCATDVGEFDHFCPKCGGPITAYASIDPLGQVYSAGRAYQRAAWTAKPRRIIVIGIWLIFGPQILTLFLAVPSPAGNIVMHGTVFGEYEGDESYWHPYPLGRGGTVFIMLLILGLVWLYTTILWKVTARYWARRTGTKVDKAEGE